MESQQHYPAGKASNSDWSVCSFIKAIYEISFQVQLEFSFQSTTKKNSHREPQKQLFMKQSEVSALPAG